MVEVAQLFGHLDKLVVTQEPNIVQMEQMSSQVVADAEQANVELDDATKKAARARRTKVWVVVIIGLVIVVAVAVVLSIVLTRSNAK